MTSRIVDEAKVRAVLDAEGLPLPADRLGPMTEAVRGYRAMADRLHEGLSEAAEPAGLVVPAPVQTERP